MTASHIGHFTDSRHDLGSIRPSRWTDQPAIRRRAQLFVAAHATDVDDCRVLLDMLGLTPTAVEVANRHATQDQDSPVRPASVHGDARTDRT